MNISILGGGSWGTALAVHLANNKHSIKVWEFFIEQAQEMQTQRKCKLLPHVIIPNNIFISSNIQEILHNTELVILVVPSDKVENTIKNAKTYLNNQPIIICSKGFSADGRLLSDVVKEQINGEVYCLYGPTHAEEVGQGLFSGIVLAGGKNKKKLKKVFASDNLKVELSSDIIGLQVSAALKNILAVFIGVLDGMNLGDNAKAYVMTKGLNEIKTIGLAMGAKKETFYGLAGVGDIIVTCTSAHSRNRFVGLEIGKGRNLDEVLVEMKMVAEGITTIKVAEKFAEKYHLELPLIRGLYDLLFKGKHPRNVLKDL
ncbi:NAD(P)-dependent glycerol-3-phosphate dehydrogenase [Candidatus Woesearchaeota archaeon]|nr:NAD(P)-dependent glycerol-3-phosphate dehydrogenase [Candidatus Woesearchaeota archaeon]